MKVVKKPLVLTLSLLAVIGMISFITLSSNSSLGDSSPITLNKDSARASGSDEKLMAMDKQFVIQDKPKVEEDEPVSEPGVIKRPKHKAENELTDIPEVGDFTETPFMPKMANETLKAQLGNASWRLFHTILARYPDVPTKQEQSTLQQYIHLFAQVYPCGDCARHFTKLLQKYPPQTKSRKTAALWGCDIHNKVNERLDKPEYDCTTILEDYDCGCGSDEKEPDYTLGNESQEHLRNIEISNEQKQRG